MDRARVEETRVAVLLRDRVVARGATTALELAGLRIVSDAAAAQVWLTEDGAIEDTLAVLVVPATPAACAGAVREVLSGGALGAATNLDMAVLPTVVHAVAGGALVITPLVASLAQHLPSLGSRELAVLRLVAENLPLREVGRRLHVSHATVKRAVTKLFDTVGVRSRVELVQVAGRLGLLEQEIPVPAGEPGRSAAPAAGRPAGRHHLSLVQHHDDP
ncbi:MAG TPA: LuxR C-terminal-related transcriptional regulator [Acidimicrobiales bacterium]|nr:LuxR C-terminal-related transcriptional regulator [Acidimicrobiales bacterium]